MAERCGRLAVALVALLVAAACSSGGNPTESAPQPTATAPAATATPAATDEPVPTPTVEPAVATAPAAPTAVPVPIDELSWEPCGPLECATLAVPIDYDDPEGPRVDLAVARVLTADPALRVGSLLLNPGGPGGSGIEWLAGGGPALPATVVERFDLVTWDPRGVGDSSGLICITDVAAGLNEVVDLTDGFADDLERYAADTADAGATCTASAPDLLGEVGTVNTARDLDLLRRALGDEQLTYLGYSYGTRLGAVYAALFPDRVRALVLDGAFPPGLSSAELAENARDFDAALGRIDRTCELEPSCAVRDVGVLDAVDTLLAELDSASPTGPLGLTDRSSLIGATLFAIYVPDAWEIFTDALGDALAGDIELVEFLAELWFVDDAGDFSDIYRGSNLAIMCADQAYAADRDQALVDAELTLEVAPVLGALLAGASCEGWPVAGEPLPDPTGVPVPPTLVIGGTHDPATPLRWAEILADQLDGSALVTYVGDGHTIAGQGNSCVDELVAAYLVDLAVPDDGTVCRAPSGILGLELQPLDGGGFEVLNAPPDRPAAETAISPGDLIIAVDGVPALTTADLVTTAGQTVELTVQTDDGIVLVDITADRRPWTLGD